MHIIFTDFYILCAFKVDIMTDMVVDTVVALEDGAKEDMAMVIIQVGMIVNFFFDF
jgi:hypothetical protein